MLIKKCFKNESGQAMIIFALAFVVVCGMTALALDVGKLAMRKSDLQNAADAAALAGAIDLPAAATARNTAMEYAEENGIAEGVEITTPYLSDPTKIEVVCKEEVPFQFAQLFGFSKKEITVRAVAMKNSRWAGEALPFINLDDDYSTNPEIEAWEKVSPGDFESINNFEIMNGSDPETCYFVVDYMNGIELKKGTVATIKQEVGYVYDQHQASGKPVYIISLSSEVIKSGKVLLKGASTPIFLSNLKNKDVIDISQLVLLECDFHDYDYKGKTLYLTFLDEYDIGHNEFPPDYVNPEGTTAKLVE